MTSRICKFGCQTLLEGWDDNAKKYIEAGTGGLHTRERCEEAKARLAQKNDHGSELGQQMNNVAKRAPDLFNALAKEDPTLIKGYVDHTVPVPIKPKLKYRTITDPTPEGYDHKLNDFAQTHNIHYTQTHIAGSLYVAVVMYEEELK